MQEAMFAYIDIYKPEYILSEDLGLLNYTSTPPNPKPSFKVTPHQMSMRRLPMIWFCEALRIQATHCQPKNARDVDPLLRK